MYYASVMHFQVLFFLFSSENEFIACNRKHCIYMDIHVHKHTSFKKSERKERRSNPPNHSPDKPTYLAIGTPGCLSMRTGGVKDLLYAC